MERSKSGATDQQKGAALAATKVKTQGLRHCASTSSMHSYRASVSNTSSPGGSPRKGGSPRVSKTVSPAGSPRKGNVGSHVTKNDPASPSKRLTRSCPTTPKQKINQKSQSARDSGKTEKVNSQVINCDIATSSKAHDVHAPSELPTDLNNETEMCLEIVATMDNNQNSIQNITTATLSYGDKDGTIIVNKVDGLAPVLNLSTFDTSITSEVADLDDNSENVPTDSETVCHASPCSSAFARFAKTSAHILYNNTIRVFLNRHNNDTLTTNDDTVIEEDDDSLNYTDHERKIFKPRKSAVAVSLKKNIQTVLTQQSTNAQPPYPYSLPRISSHIVEVCPKASPEDCESPPMSKRGSCDQGNAVLMVSNEESWIPFSKGLQSNVKTKVVSPSSPEGSPNPVRKKRCNII